MLGLTSPVWLAALTTLALPLVIHLWSHRTRRVVRVGSLRHLDGAPAARSLSLRVTDPLLLAVRALMLVPLVLLLAGLGRHTGNLPTDPIVLVAPEVLNDPVALADEVVDSLRRAGVEIRVLATGFPRASLDPAGGPYGGPSGDTWDLLTRADNELQASRFIVLAPARLHDDAGPRPTLVTPVIWHALTGMDGGSRIDAAWVSGGMVHILLASGVDGWTIRRESLAIPVPTVAGPLTAEQIPGDSIRVALTHPGGRRETRTLAEFLHPIGVTVTAEADRRDDARYLLAALRTVNAALGDVLDIRTVSGTANVAPGDWIVRLSDGPPPQDVLDAVRRGAFLLEDNESTGDAVGVASTILPAIGYLVAPIHLRTALPSPAGATLLTDGEGNPVLTVDALGKGQWYRFAARFHPTWTGLVTDRGLPELLLTMMAPRGIGARGAGGSVRVEAGSMVPHLAPARTGTGPSQTLRLPLVLLAAILLVSERLLANRRSPMRAA